MKTKRKPSKPRTKPSATRNSGSCRSARGGGGKTQRASPGKAKRKRKRKKARKRWVPQRRITDKEVERWCRRIVRGLDRERRRCGISLDDVAGPAGLTRQCLGMVRRRKGASFLSTIVRYFYALGKEGQARKTNITRECVGVRKLTVAHGAGTVVRRIGPRQSQIDAQFHFPHPPAMPSVIEIFAESLAPVEGCLNRESAIAILNLPPNPRVQSRVDELAEKCNEGTMTPEERAEYDALIWADHFLGILQSKAEHYLQVHAAA